MYRYILFLLLCLFSNLLNAQTYLYNYYPYGYDQFLSRQIDEAIISNIQNALQANKTPGSSHPIKIHVKNGIVTLSGSLNTEQEKQTLFLAVNQVPGVRRIIDRVLVRASPYQSLENTPSPFFNNPLQEQIANILGQQESPDFANVKIYVNDGYVVLTGTVESVELKREAAKRIRTIPKVIGIENRILIDLKQE